MKDSKLLEKVYFKIGKELKWKKVGLVEAKIENFDHKLGNSIKSI
jgi:hypothetical protein